MTRGTAPPDKPGVAEAAGGGLAGSTSGRLGGRGRVARRASPAALLERRVVAEAAPGAAAGAAPPVDGNRSACSTSDDGLPGASRVNTLAYPAAGSRDAGAAVSGRDAAALGPRTAGDGPLASRDQTGPNTANSGTNTMHTTMIDVRNLRIVCEGMRGWLSEAWVGRIIAASVSDEQGQAPPAAAS